MIVGGEEITINEAPWVGSLQLLDQHICGVTIVTRRHALTTATCVEDQEGILDNALVRVGSTFHNREGLLKALRAIAAHEEFNVPSIGNNDIAILTFKYPLNFGTDIQPIRVAAPQSQLAANTSLILVGWARAEEGQDEEEVPDALQATELFVVPNEPCAAAHANATEAEDADSRAVVTAQHVCAIDNEVNGNTACNVRDLMESARLRCELSELNCFFQFIFQGDTGSPLILLTASGAVLQGLASWHSGCGEDTAPGVFTAIAPQIDWIRANL